MGFGRGSYDFNNVGPTHLKHVDWTNPDHRRIVAACLVMGVYDLEHDRQDNKGELALPQERPWFTFFGFKLVLMLIDHDKDNSIYGAIYGFEHPSHLPPKAPEYVIAFRGTVLTAESFKEDVKLNIQILHQRFHKKKRTIRATEVVESVVWPKKGTEDEDEDDCKDKDVPVWLVGHSLGSSLAIQAGKKVAEKGVFLETFLFNPPYPSLGPERVPIKKIRDRIKKRTKKWKTKLANHIKGSKQIHEDKVKFAKLSKWSPHIFVHRNDWICSGYIGYFEQRKTLPEINDHEWMLDAMYSTRALWKDAWKQTFKKKKAIEKKSDYYEPFYLLPCASLNISTRGVDKERGSDHGIRQWWMEDLQLENTSYTFDVSKLLEALGEQPSTPNDPPVDPWADKSSSSQGSQSLPILPLASPAPSADSESAQMEVARVGGSGSSVIGISGSGSISRETFLSITPFVGETRNLEIMGTASSSSIPPRLLLIATAPLRVFLHVAHVSSLTEIAEDLPVYQETVSPSLKYIQSSGASLSSLGPTVLRIFSLGADYTQSSNGLALEVIRPVLVSRRDVTERELLGLYDEVVNLVSLLGSAYVELDAKRKELADVKKSEEDLAAELEHIRTCRISLEDKADELNKMVQDQQGSLKSTSSLIKDRRRSKQSLDSDLRRLSSDADFYEKSGAEHLSSIEAEFLSSIEDALSPLQDSGCFGSSLGSAYVELDAKRKELADVKKWEEDLAAELEHIRTRRISLEDKVDELNKMVQDQQGSLKCTSLIKDRRRSKQSLDSDLRRLSSDADFYEKSGAEHLSSIEAEFLSSIEDALSPLQDSGCFGSSLGSAYAELDAKRKELAHVKKSEDDLAAKLEHIRTRRRSLEDEADRLYKKVQDQQGSLKSTSSLIKDHRRSMESLDSDLRRLSLDAVFCEKLRDEHLSSIEAEFHKCIEGALFLLQGSC